jgi:hypothetical protein
MNHRIAAICLGLLLVTGTLGAEPILRWDPDDPHLDVGQQITLSIMLDDALDVRTFELYVSFDAAVIGTVSGGHGALFDGFNNFTGFSEIEPGLWRCYCVILGASDWTTGPGELWRVTISGLADGVTPLVAVDLVLLPPGGGSYPDAVLPGGQVRVGEVTGVLPDPSDLALRPRVTLWPNPFNPHTRVEVAGMSGGRARLEVLDLRGRLVRDLWQGTAVTNAFSAHWDGRDDQGRSLPSGIYTVRLVGERGQHASSRGVLVR